MFKKINVSNHIYWIGVNDRKKHLFENIVAFAKRRCLQFVYYHR